MTGVARVLRPKVSGDLLVFLGSSIAYQASRFGVTLAAAALLEPAGFGTWGVVFTLLAYTVYGNLGILSGANRVIPIRLGQGRDEEALELERIALGGAIGSGIVMLMAVLAVAVVANAPQLEIWVASAFAVGTQQLYLFAQVSLRARQRFDAASSQQLLLAVLFPALGVPLLIAAGTAGLAVAQATAYSAGAALLWVVWRRGLRPRLSIAATLAVMRDGFPVMLSGLAYTAMTSMDRWVVLWLGGSAQLGQYALASIVSSSLMFISLVVAQQFYPQVARAYGAGMEHPGLVRLAIRQGATAVALSIPVGAITIVGAPYVIPALAPEYSASIPAIQLLVLAYLVLASSTGFSNLLVATGRAWLNVAIQLSAAALGTVLAIVAMQAGASLGGVAAAMVVALSGTAVVVAIATVRTVGR